MKLSSVCWYIMMAAIFCSFKGNATFHGYDLNEFSFQGHQAKVVSPKKRKKKNNHWIWRARFWGHEPQTDLALLKKGFHLVYIDVGDQFGNQVAVERWNDFYAFIRKEYNLNEKVVLEGMSRGGLIVYNWAAQNPDKVACIYADAPVCDIKSWPGGLYNGKGSKGSWEKCLAVFELDEESVLDFEGIPLISCKKVAEAKIPMLHVCGAADDVVPYEENTAILAARVKELGGEIEVILKEGVGHHPHSLADPKPIVKFILKHTLRKR